MPRPTWPDVVNGTVTHAIEKLDKMFPPPTPGVHQLVTEKDRLELAAEIGRRELIDNLILAIRQPNQPEEVE